MRIKIILIVGSFFTLFLPNLSFAAEELSSINLKTDFNVWEVRLKHYGLLSDQSISLWNHWPVELPSDSPSVFSESIDSQLKFEKVKGIDPLKWDRYLKKRIASKVERESQNVVIDLSDDGKVLFDGFALDGQRIDYLAAYHLFNKAFNEGVSSAYLPFFIDKAKVEVKSKHLIDKGITTLISTGETDFSGSPSNRLNNIRVGLSSFNGQLIGPGEDSGAGQILGKIDKTTGYKEELVIKGDKTVPEYGGGLCQVSTTVYRGLLHAGIPITQRRNHSYAVSYYDPQGLDATIYPPYVDMKFRNDTSGHILIQTMTTKKGRAFANIYGTPVEREVDLIGPFYYAHKEAPKPRVEYTSELKPGEEKVVGNEHDGFKASWYRYIKTDDDVKIEHIFSNYQPRPHYKLIGAEVDSLSSSGDQQASSR